MGETVGPWSGLPLERASPGLSGLSWLPSESLPRVPLPGGLAWLLAGSGPCLLDTSVPGPSCACLVFLVSA